MPTARKTRRLLVLGVMVGVGAVAFALWPRGARLEWYTSPPVRVGLRQVRLRLLVPSGWKADAVRPDIWSLLTGRRAAVFPGTQNDTLLGVEPALVIPWLPGVFRRLLGLPEQELGAFVAVELRSDGSTLHADKDISIHRGNPTAGNPDDAWFVIGEPGLRFVLRYRRFHRAEFESTYRQICESFRVVRE